jgi:hypothetical protein
MYFKEGIRDYVEKLQELLKEKNDQDLLNKAEEILGGQDDYRYLVLEQFLDSVESRFINSPSEDPPKETSPTDDEPTRTVK